MFALLAHNLRAVLQQLTPEIDMIFRMIRASLRVLVLRHTIIDQIKGKTQRSKKMSPSLVVDHTEQEM